MTMDRKTYAREWARRRRAAKLAAERQSATRCPKKLGLYGRCGGALRTVVLSGGATAIVCDLCERQRKGICRECGQRVVGTVGKALRCALHKRLAHLAHYEKFRAEHQKEIARRAREYARRADVRARRCEYKRLWRAANPGKVRAQKRRAALRQPERTREYHREYYAQYDYQRAASRSCLTCPTIVTGRAKKCEGCRVASRLTARQRLQQMVAA